MTPGRSTKLPNAVSLLEVSIAIMGPADWTGELGAGIVIEKEPVLSACWVPSMIWLGR